MDKEKRMYSSCEQLDGELDIIVEDYLNLLKEVESCVPEKWMKYFIMRKNQLVPSKGLQHNQTKAFRDAL